MQPFSFDLEANGDRDVDSKARVVAVSAGGIGVFVGVCGVGARQERQRVAIGGCVDCVLQAAEGVVFRARAGFSVADVIHARTDLALTAANEQLDGKLSQRINRLRDDLMHPLDILKNGLDTPETSRTECCYF